MAAHCLQTGQRICYDENGAEIPCSGSGQDGELRRGDPWPEPRFEVVGGAGAASGGEVVRDNLTGLHWLRDANAATYPLSWQESLDHVGWMNEAAVSGYDDWRLPDRRELRSLLSHQTRNPALPEGHPFKNVVLSWYWTSTSAAINPAYAWYVHMEGARCFYGAKDQYFLLWPVRGEGNGVLPATGQRRCFGHDGHEVPCVGSGQDGEYRSGRAWPEPRFQVEKDSAVDLLTGLRWLRTADAAAGDVTWQEALEAVAQLNADGGAGDVSCRGWRLPNINELESLVDLGRHSPALPSGHPFRKVREGYWSSTTSAFEPDWAWALYLTKGAVGIGRKRGAYFSAWAVRDA
jgi:hypothetical protein